MTWQRRARDLLLAGGALALGACTTGGSSGGSPDVRCGSSNPDPCICGRPDADVHEAALCDQEKACQAAGGSWTYGGGCVTEGGAPMDASSDAPGDAPGDAADGSSADAADGSAGDAASDSAVDGASDSAADAAVDSAVDAGEVDAADAAD